MSKELLPSTRNIFAVCFNLQQFCSKASLYLEQNCCKSSQTFGKKFLIVCQVIILCSCPAFQTTAQEEIHGLKLSISEIKSKDKNSNPTFFVTFENTGKTDYVFNLGMMVSNGKKLYPNVHIFLTNENDSIKDLEFKGLFVINGRVDPYIVPLKSGALYSLRFNLKDDLNDRRLNLSTGKYKVYAKYVGKGCTRANEDMRGITTLNFWEGTLNSNELIIKI